MARGSSGTCWRVFKEAVAGLRDTAERSSASSPIGRRVGLGGVAGREQVGWGLRAHLGRSEARVDGAGDARVVGQQQRLPAHAARQAARGRRAGGEGRELSCYWQRTSSAVWPPMPSRFLPAVCDAIRPVLCMRPHLWPRALSPTRSQASGPLSAVPRSIAVFRQRGVGQGGVASGDASEKSRGCELF